MRGFLAQLKNRRVLKVAVGYLLVSWLVREVGHPSSALITVGFPLLLFAA